MLNKMSAELKYKCNQIQHSFLGLAGISFNNNLAGC